MAFSNLQHLCLLLISISPILAYAQTDKNIPLGSSLLASDNSSPWKSPSGDFAFGFCQLDNQNLFLLAIWFDKIPDKTIVWYANGDNPAPKASRLDLTDDGQLILKNPQGQVIWKSHPSSGATYAAMLDTGNFVLANRDSIYVWESFKYPKDTILPTQELEVGMKLYSRQTDDNYSKGRFQLRFLPEGSLVLNTIALPTDFAYTNYYHSNTSDGLNGMNSGYKVVFNESGYISIIKRNGNAVNLTLENNIASSRDFYHRATLDFDGIFTQYAHPKAPKNGNWDQSWFSVWYEPKDICFDMTGDYGRGACGYNSFCTLDSFGRPACEFLPGFSLVDPGNKFTGCKQDKVRKCDIHGDSKPEDLYEIHVVSNIFWPTSSNYERFPLSSEDECSSSCFDDCDCVVAVIKDGNCWKKKLPLSNGRLERNTYGKALIKVPKSDESSETPLSPNSDSGKKDQTTMILIVSILLGGSVFVNLIFVAVISLVMFCSYQKKQKPTAGTRILETNLRSFTYKDLRDATDGFREELGRGAFGTVYKGVISTSMSKITVAVKKLNKLAQEGEKEFKTEAIAIANTHHKNLVRLLGFCDEGPHRLLVYEFMSNGTLASFVFGISKPDWNKRIQMAVGIARGLMYLHEVVDPTTTRDWRYI